MLPMEENFLMQKTLDPVINAAAVLKKKTADWPRLLAYGLVFAFSLWMYYWQDQFIYTDFHVHMMVAGSFDFADLHSITSRLAYPAWHLCVSILYQLGIPLVWAASLVTSLAKVATMFLGYLLITVIAGEGVKRKWITLAGFLLMLVTGILIPGVNDTVYKGIGSPNVWHNPTQMMVNVSMLLSVPFVSHCWHEFERIYPLKGRSTLLPWSKAALLMVLLLFSLACKPTFMQALLPACAIFFLIQWIRHPECSRFFLQMILVFLPAALYFLLQYLYYTGVVVPYTSGVEFGVTAQSAWNSIRGILITCAFPLYALLVCHDKDKGKDAMLNLTLLMVLISALESMFFRETGLRLGHGNFNWASMSASLMLWILMLGRFIRSFAAYRQESSPRSPGRSLAFGAGFAMLLWHSLSGVYYIVYLFSTNSSF